ncbi:MAG: TetR/AcrR family transcriptional regulator, partial [Novosphingobium sp.]
MLPVTTIASPGISASGFSSARAMEECVNVAAAAPAKAVVRSRIENGSCMNRPPLLPGSSRTVVCMRGDRFLAKYDRVGGGGMSRLFAVNLLSREKEREGKCRFVMLSEIAVKPPSDRLVDTVLDLWETVGSAGVSVRRISDASGIPVSSIYHYFGSLEQLFVVAQEVALAEARDWCHEQLRQLSDFPGQRSAFAGFFSQLVDGWAFEQRRLAFCWREGQLLAETGEGFRGVVRQWDTLWSRFWQEAGGMFTLARDTIVAQRIFETESLMHMLCWRRAVDRAGLDELGRGLGAWLTGAPMPDSPWRDFAREQAVRSVPSLPARDDVAAAIVAVAGDLIGAGGVAALTHRSVAEHAGVTLGVVLHRFKTKAHLVEAAFEAIYQSLVNGLQEYPPAADA